MNCQTCGHKMDCLIEPERGQTVEHCRSCGTAVYCPWSGDQEWYVPQVVQRARELLDNLGDLADWEAPDGAVLLPKAAPLRECCGPPEERKTI